MILLKKIVDDKITYEEVTMEEALKLSKKDLVFTDEDEEETYDDRTEEMEEAFEEKNKFFDKEKFNESMNRVGEKITESMSAVGKTVKTALKKAGDSVAQATSKVSDILSNKFQKGSKAAKIASMIPFMDEEDIHSLALKILNGDPECKGIDIITIMPFMSDGDADLLFINYLNQEGNHDKIGSLAPFVSESCLSEVVSRYINGRYPDIDITCLYPFMDKKDIKRLFDYIVKTKEN